MKRFITQRKKELLVSISVGFFAFALAPVFGVSEPWDGEVYFRLILFTIVLLGFVFKQWVMAAFGVCVGQALFHIFVRIVFPASEQAVWWMLGLFISVVSLFPIIVLTGLGRLLRRAAERLKNNP